MNSVIAVVAVRHSEFRCGAVDTCCTLDRRIGVLVGFVAAW